MNFEETSAQGIWCAKYPVRLGPLRVTARTTVVQLGDGGLWIHSPGPLDEPALAELRGLGQVRYLVAPNNSHHLHLDRCRRIFPNAAGYVAPGLAQRSPEYRQCPPIDPASAPWRAEIGSFFIEGLPLLDETVFFHSASGTLIVTDLLFCFGPTHPRIHRLLARALGVFDRLAMSRTMRLAIRDRHLLARSLAPLMELPVERVILAHGDIVDHDAAGQLRRAFAFLRN